MNVLTRNIKWLMLASGALTCTMVYAAIAPDAALTATFGATLDGPVAAVVVRNWGALIALIGGMLIYGAFHPPSRPLALTVAGLSKLVFIALVLAQGQRFMGYQAGQAVVIDSVMVVLFAGYMISSRKARRDVRHEYLST
jgi:hypothetical protein